MKSPFDKIVEDSETWNEIDPLNVNRQIAKVNSQDSWNRLVLRQSILRKRTWYAYAAAVSLIVVSLAGGYYKWFINPLINVIATENVVKHLLPDSSTVWIKPSTVLSYDQYFGVRNRRLNLEGSGFFEVRKNKGLPFIIESPQSTVEVLGTSFLYETNENPHVQVFTGTVKFQNNGSIYKTLNKGEAAVLVSKDIFKNESFDQNAISWKTQKMVFTAEPIENVLSAVSQFYDTKLSIDTANNISITATFNDISLAEVVDFLEIASGLEIRVINNQPSFKQ